MGTAVCSQFCTTTATTTAMLRFVVTALLLAAVVSAGTLSKKGKGSKGSGERDDGPEPLHHGEFKEMLADLKSHFLGVRDDLAEWAKKAEQANDDMTMGNLETWRQIDEGTDGIASDAYDYFGQAEQKLWSMAERLYLSPGLFPPSDTCHNLIDFVNDETNIDDEGGFIMTADSGFTAAYYIEADLKCFLEIVKGSEGIPDDIEGMPVEEAFDMIATIYMHTFRVRTFAPRWHQAVVKVGEALDGFELQMDANNTMEKRLVKKLIQLLAKADKMNTMLSRK